MPAAQPPSTIAPLPPPNALTDVLARMADANIPGADKLDLVENATPADGAAMDKFATALRDGGYAPATFGRRTSHGPTAPTASCWRP